jgi:hypothetical protein
VEEAVPAIVWLEYTSYSTAGCMSLSMTMFVLTEPVASIATSEIKNKQGRLS